MARECDDVRVLPEVVNMGPVIELDDGLRLRVRRKEGVQEGVEVGMEWDPTTPWGALGSMDKEDREKWMLGVVQKLNRVIAEGLDGCELVLPQVKGSSGR